jgi:hypothetical protein
MKGENAGRALMVLVIAVALMLAPRVFPSYLVGQQIRTGEAIQLATVMALVLVGFKGMTDPFFRGRERAARVGEDNSKERQEWCSDVYKGIRENKKEFRELVYDATAERAKKIEETEILARSLERQVTTIQQDTAKSMSDIAKSLEDLAVTMKEFGREQLAHGKHIATMRGTLDAWDGVEKRHSRGRRRTDSEG